ncbi:phosphate transport system permease protein [Cellulomonas chitinilytica]|uniref:Phosphate transport system permease protein n=1 Tax=Cellulomonas chitinilytica TaxID=398759 RepID=A0A919U2N8_9CELL|nr:phosphate ABC transporter permease subunit PstC [Cellulomonas chitinilytica]GIG22521.1 phosphate transport system permease protein [Cellulomonas chitinilytica]
MASPTTATTPPVTPVRTPRRRSRPADRGLDRSFRYVAVGSGMLILATLASVAIFLIIEAMPALTHEDLASEIPWIPKGGDLWSVVGPLIFGTILAAIVSLVVAVPVAVGIALFISHYAPRRMANALGYVVDLLAAIPSVVFGLWGVMVLAPKVQPVWQFLVDYLGWIPLFAGDAHGNASNPPRVLMTTSIVLAVMILPIITAVSREVFLQTPRLHEEAALALGATRWELIRMAVLPFGRSGVTSAAMLGLGRALGETMAVLMILSPGLLYSFKLLVASQQQTIAANIAARFNDANDIGRSTLIATGLALFVITLLVNLAARAIIARRKDFSGAN